MDAREDPAPAGSSFRGASGVVASREGEDSVSGRSEIRTTTAGLEIVERHLEVVLMADILIRDVPDRVLRAIDVAAERQEVSRSEYLRHLLERTVRSSEVSVTVGDLELFAEAFSDLQGSDAMKRAWE
ncbi:hypothetical protein ACFW4K_11835 [Nocardiopsis alba]|uniref:type II toxin-antitoxin system VapB family antitoxin n=1 Tax=Nocardiopsis alba TaxID=53437 RepID=UPI00366A8E10